MHTHTPPSQVIGVEPTGANGMAMSLAQGRRVTLSRVDAFADGVAVKQVICRLFVKHDDRQALLDNWCCVECVGCLFVLSVITTRVYGPSLLVCRIARNPQSLVCSLSLSLSLPPNQSTLNPQVGAETFRLCRQLLDGVLLVDNAAISAAIKDVFNETRSILEPAGAVAVAGAKAWLQENGHKVCGSCVVYGRVVNNFRRGERRVELHALLL